ACFLFEHLIREGDPQTNVFPTSVHAPATSRHSARVLLPGHVAFVDCRRRCVVDCSGTRLRASAGVWSGGALVFICRGLPDYLSPSFFALWRVCVFGNVAAIG